MNLKDLLIYDTGNGGDIFISSDILLGEPLAQMAYLCLFGGNIEAETKGNEKKSELRFDWWGNSLIFKDSIDKQFNSQTEQILNNIALNSSGRVKILQSVKNDLKPLKSFARFEAEVFILSDTRLKIQILIQKPNNEEKTLSILWDDLKKNNIIEKLI